MKSHFRADSVVFVALNSFRINNSSFHTKKFRNSFFRQCFILKKYKQKYKGC